MVGAPPPHKKMWRQDFYRVSVEAEKELTWLDESEKLPCFNFSIPHHISSAQLAMYEQEPRA